MSRVAATMISWVARALPRGGFPLVRLAARYVPELRRYPIGLSLIPGVRVQADLGESVWYPLWPYGHYPHQLPEDRVALQFLRPGETVWDVGANIGYTALIYSSAVGPGGQVVAFEPGAKAFAYLERTITDAGNVRCFNLAVSDSPGRLHFAEEQSLDLSGISAPRTGSYVVQAVSLDGFLAESGLPAPDFLKIDVEGHEPAVIAGSASLISTRLPMIQFEALSPEKREESSGLLHEIAGGAYRIHRVTRSAALTAPGDSSRERCTNDYLAFVERDSRRFEPLLES